jgi:hypothetical protein
MIMKLKQSTWKLIEMIILNALSLTLFVSAVNDFINGSYGWVLFAGVLIALNCWTIYKLFEEWKTVKKIETGFTD